MGIRHFVKIRNVNIKSKRTRHHTFSRRQTETAIHDANIAYLYETFRQRFLTTEKSHKSEKTVIRSWRKNIEVIVAVSLLVLFVFFGANAS